MNGHFITPAEELGLDLARQSFENISMEAMMGLSIDAIIGEIASSLERDISSVRPSLRKFVIVFKTEFSRAGKKRKQNRRES